MADKTYDVVVVGSGATGGIAAKELSERGLQVLVLEAGRSLNSPQMLSNGIPAMTKRLYNLATGQQSRQASHPGYWKANPDLFINEQDNPYTTPENKPFSWTRGRQVGGKSLTWGGITLRLSDYEFKATSQDGFGQDWPIAYSDLAPYYDYLERFFQVQGRADGLPQLPDGCYARAATFTPAEAYLKSVLETSGDAESRLIISRGFSLHPQSERTPNGSWPRSSSLGSSLVAALTTGRVTLQSDAVVSHLNFGPGSDKATGVTYFDRIHHTQHTVHGRSIMLCASAIESVRILLHSTAAYQTNGLANASDLLGRYLMDHVSTSRFFVLPTAPPLEKPTELSGSGSFFIPRSCNLGNQDQPFLRGYGLWGGIQRFGVPAVLQKVDGAIGFLIGHGEVLPQHHNRVTLDPNVVDAWGIPVPHIDCQWSDNEMAMVQHMHQRIESIVQQAGGRCMGLTDLFHAPLMGAYLRKMEKILAFAAPPGYYIHEVGGACMGTSPQNSVVNAHNQCWEAPNVFVTDGACWTSSGWQSPTLTSMALTARASEFIAQQLGKGEF
ncbi:MAG: GMC family oxidoreductase [Cyanothece sp. SIO2G6]|nr:GMC family oxidoreductase [Cyanothece sp. SIO2G6]